MGQEGKPLKDNLDPQSRRLAMGWTEPEKDPAKRRCRWCGELITNKRRRTFCGPACVAELRIRSDPGFARSKVQERDRGVCGQCGIDTARLVRLLNLLIRVGWGTWYPVGRVGWVNYNDPRTYPSATRRREQAEIMLALLGLWAGESLQDRWLRTPRLRRSLWEMDHIVPVVEGGGQCGLENLRTLCLRCHKGATANLAARRARARNPQQDLLR